MRVEKVVIRLIEELYENLRRWEAVENSQRDGGRVQAEELGTGVGARSVSDIKRGMEKNLQKTENGDYGDGRSTCK